MRKYSKDLYERNFEQNSQSDFQDHIKYKELQEKVQHWQQDKDAIIVPMNFQTHNTIRDSLAQNSPVKELKKGYLPLRVENNRFSELGLSKKSDNKEQDSSSRPMFDIPIIESNFIQKKGSMYEDYLSPTPQIKQQIQERKQQSKTENLRKKIVQQPETQIIRVQEKVKDYYRQRNASQLLKSNSPKKSNVIRNSQFDKINSKLFANDKIEKGKVLPRYLQPLARQPQRQSAVRATTQFLSGKLSIIWIFVIRQELTHQQIKRIKKIYNASTNPDEDDDGSENNKFVPLCKYSWEMQELLKLPNCYFKVVTDIANTFGVFKFRSKKEIFQFYIYNNEGQDGFTHAINFKCTIAKVKGIEHSLNKILNRAEQQIENQLQMYRMKNQLIVRKSQRKFPSFLRLSGIDKTQATLYRSNLYGALKITLKQKKIYYKHFMQLVYEKYDRKGKQAKNIEDYEQFNHEQNICNLEQSEEIIKFYIKQSFYYGILNSMLRTMKTTEQFKYCILPFNQTYHAIKMFYQNDLLPSRKLPKMTLYRGTRLKQRDFQFLKPGVFIEMFGFMSTSKKLQTAKKFADSADSYIFVIHVHQTTIAEQNDKYDHGFLDVNKHNLAGQFSFEEEVLFNALNIFRVLKVQQEGQYSYIHLEYGVIFDLLKKKKDKLTVDEKDVLINYKYCTSMLDKIQDQGDVLLFANEYEASKKYYEEKIVQESNNANTYLKLAFVQQQCGQIQQAQKNVNICYQKTTKKIEKYDRQTALKVFGIHSLNADINLQLEDFFLVDDNLEKAISCLQQGLDDFERAKKYRELGLSKFKRGQIKQAQQYLSKSQELFVGLLKELQDKKWEINKTYYKKLLTFLCLGPSYKDISNQRQEKMKNIEDIHQKALEIKDQIKMELLKLTKAQQEVFQYAQDKQQYQRCVKKAIQYLSQIKKEQTQDPYQKAQINVMQATVKGYAELAESQKLLSQAIDLVQSTDPYHLKVAEYSEILAKFQKADLDKFNNPIMHIEPDQNGKIPYSEKQRIRAYEKSKQNYQKAIYVLMYNNKAQNSTQIMYLKNELIELDFNEGHFESCEQIIKQTKQATKQNKNYHTELAKTNLMMGKISLARGQTKKAFEATEQAYNILRKALVKKQEEKYQTVFEKSDCYLNILILKSKIFQKQMKFDLSLKQIKSLEIILNDKFKNDAHTLFADMYEEYATYFVGVDQIQDFDDYYDKALRIRQQQMGEVNLPNAICRCKYAVHLLLTDDVEAAREQLQKAVQIFSRLSQQNPIIWIVEYTNGYIYEYLKQFEQATNHYEKSLILAEQKLDPTHISVCKMQFLFGKSLTNLNQFEKAYQILQSLSGVLVNALNESHDQFVQISDDEKLSLTKTVYRTLAESSLRQSMMAVDIRATQAATQRKQIYEQKMSFLRKTYAFLE